MELQALRYAAMVSALTFEDLVDTFQGFLVRERQDASNARSRLAEWLDDGEDTVLSREVRILLASADFGREITTTALWLNEVYNTDIRCVKITPYRVEGRLLLNVEQIIPLPEAEEYTVGVRRRAVANRTARVPIRTGPDTSSRRPTVRVTGSTSAGRYWPWCTQSTGPGWNRTIWSQCSVIESSVP